MKVIPYLMFDGNAEEALNFYKEIFDAKEPEVMRYSDGQGFEIPDNYADKIMHGELYFGDNILYLSDNFPDKKTVYGNGISFNIDPETEEDLNRLFAALSVGGEVVQPLKKEFWGSIFGSLNDKFGIHWSFNYTLPQED